MKEIKLKIEGMHCACGSEKNIRIAVESSIKQRKIKIEKC